MKWLATERLASCLLDEVLPLTLLVAPSQRRVSSPRRTCRIASQRPRARVVPRLDARRTLQRYPHPTNGDHQGRLNSDAEQSRPGRLVRHAKQEAIATTLGPERLSPARSRPPYAIWRDGTRYDSTQGADVVVGPRSHRDIAQAPREVRDVAAGYPLGPRTPRGTADVAPAIRTRRRRTC